MQDEGFERISDLVGLSHLELEELPISPVFVRRFKKLVDWYENQDNPSVALWFTLTSDMFASYIPSYAVSKAQKTTASVGSEIQVPDFQTSGGTQMATFEATKSLSILPGVKRNVTDFPKLTSDADWFIFKRLFKSSASAQGLWHVFNPDPDCFYLPVGEQQ